jgi:phosphohistidine phosphatase
MKTLYLIRHAKSDWDNPKLPDINRPLNKRGEKDAPMMADVLKKKNIKPDLLLSSPSVRTTTTAKYFCKALEYDYKKVIIENDIYLASFQTLLNIINKLDYEFNSVVVFGHNPGITDMVNSLSPTRIDNVPTCGIAAISSKAESWVKINKSNSSLMFFEYPKKYK